MVAFLVGAPSSGSGKTVVTTGLIAAMRRRGHDVVPAKVGPDYIDPSFLGAAAGRPAVNIDLWAMRPELVDDLAAHPSLIAEGVMGLFDGPASGPGSSADVAARLSLPVVLVVDAARQSQSVAALVHGFATFDERLDLAGVILSRVASARHEAMLRHALERAGQRCLGALPRDDRLALPSRHLGLVLAGEDPALAERIAAIGDAVEAGVDIAAVERLDAGRERPGRCQAEPLPPPGSRIAVASDAAFAFSYAHLIDGWRRAGAEVIAFSPLAGEGPASDADAVVLPGGYPELHAGALAAQSPWREGLADAAWRGAVVYGECGGYMALGRALIDADGTAHEMAGLLEVVTSFARPRRTLGYRRLRCCNAWLPQDLAGHEFHYATVEAEGPPLFDAFDSAGTPLGPMGTRSGTVMGSFAHVIDCREGALR